MVEIKTINNQLDELKKLSYGFYLGLKRGKEPLTYTFKDEDGTEHQVEVNVDKEDGQNLLVQIGFDTHFTARFDKSVGTIYSFRLSESNVWQPID